MQVIKLTPKEWGAANPKDNTGDWGVYGLYAEEGLYALTVDAVPVSYHASYFQKSKKKNGWGRYMNWYFAYTLRDHRRKGYATQLYRHIEVLALEAGIHRVKSLVQSDLGYYLHRGLHHQFWGTKLSKEGHLDLIVDSPIAPGYEYPEGTPTEVRTNPGSHLMTPQECEAWVLTVSGAAQ